MSNPKYVAITDDAEPGYWLVISISDEMPAVVDDIPQVRLSKDDADDIARILNEMTSEEDG